MRDASADVVLTLLGILVALVIASGTTAWQVRSARKEAAAERDHQRAMHREQRRLDRVSPLYVDLLQLLREVERVEKWTHTGPDAKAERDRTTIEIQRLDARMAVFASLTVREHWTTWTAGRNGLRRALDDQDRLRARHRREHPDSPAGPEGPEMTEIVAAGQDGYRKRQDASYAIEQAVRIELDTLAYDMERHAIERPSEPPPKVGTITRLRYRWRAHRSRT